MSIYVIRIKGNLAHHWSSWSADMAIDNETSGEAVRLDRMCGPL